MRLIEKLVIHKLSLTQLHFKTQYIGNSKPAHRYHLFLCKISIRNTARAK